MVSDPSPPEAIEPLQKQEPRKLIKTSPPLRARAFGCNYTGALMILSSCSQEKFSSFPTGL
jgi:hypothetical protein